jgi:ABC-type transport system involved in Fe-S cluster assembly fused permease/ATPase subunit
MAIIKPLVVEISMAENEQYQKKTAIIIVKTKVINEILIKDVDRRKIKRRQNNKNGSIANTKRIKSTINYTQLPIFKMLYLDRC